MREARVGFVNVVIRPLAVPALLVALALILFLPAGAGAAVAFDEHCATTGCESVPAVEEDAEGYESCPSTYSCHPTVEHHHAPAGVAVLVGTEVLATRNGSLGGMSAPRRLSGLAAAEGPERPPRFTR